MTPAKRVKQLEKAIQTHCTELDAIMKQPAGLGRGQAIAACINKLETQLKAK